MRGNVTAIAWLQRGLLAVLGTTLVVVGLQATGNAVATVNVSDGTVWLVNPPTGTVVQVSAASEQVTAAVRVATAGEPLTGAQDGHSAVVLNRATGEIGRVDGVGLSYGQQTTLRRLLRRPICSCSPGPAGPTCSTPPRAGCERSIRPT